MTSGWVFPGQGAKELPDAVEAALAAGGEGRALLERAARCAGLDGGADLLSRGGRALERTAVAQPALVAVCLSLAAAEASPPEVALGQSLGELVAWIVARGVPPAAAVELAARRGRSMEAACRSRPGRMLAVGAPEPGALTRALEAGRAAGELAVATTNGPSELVLGGDEAAVRVAARVLGGTLLRTEGAFHTALMAPAVDPFAAALAAAPLGAPRCAVAWSTPGPPPASVDEERAWLAASLARPIDFGLAVRRAGGVELQILGPPSAVRHALRSSAQRPPGEPS